MYGVMVYVTQHYSSFDWSYIGAIVNVNELGKFGNEFAGVLTCGTISRCGIVSRCGFICPITITLSINLNKI